MLQTADPASEPVWQSLVQAITPTNWLRVGPAERGTAPDQDFSPPRAGQPAQWWPILKAMPTMDISRGAGIHAGSREPPGECPESGWR